MIGLILWFIIIFLIALATCPGLIGALSGILAIGFTVILIGLRIQEFLTDRKDKKKLKGGKAPSSISTADRELAIREWERKWRRPHPTRTFIASNRNCYDMNKLLKSKD